MKTTTKIIILVVCVLLACGGVMYFFKTQVEPPQAPEATDQYSVCLENRSGEVEKIAETDRRKKAYRSLRHLIDFAAEQDAIGESQGDRAIERADSAHAAFLTEKAYDIYRSNVWPMGELNGILAELDFLGHDRTLSGDGPLDGRSQVNIDEVREVKSNYDKALALSRRKGFFSLDDAARRLSEARRYLQEDYLANNTALCEALGGLPEAIAKSHYRDVEKKVRSLADYEGYSSDDYFNLLVPEVTNALNEYLSTNIYGSAKPSAAQLQTDVQGYENEARSYYEWGSRRNIF